jgi:hypothetical protein
MILVRYLIGADKPARKFIDVTFEELRVWYATGVRSAIPRVTDNELEFIKLPAHHPDERLK